MTRALLALCESKWVCFFSSWEYLRAHWRIKGSCQTTDLPWIFTFPRHPQLQLLDGFAWVPLQRVNFKFQKIERCVWAELGGLREHWVCSLLMVCFWASTQGITVLLSPAWLSSAYMVGRMSEMHWILILCSSFLCLPRIWARSDVHSSRSWGAPSMHMRSQPARTMPVKMVSCLILPHRQSLGQGCVLPWWSFTRKHWKRRALTM